MYIIHIPLKQAVRITFFIQAIEDLRPSLNSVLIGSVDTPELDVSCDGADGMPS